MREIERRRREGGRRDHCRRSVGWRTSWLPARTLLGKVLARVILICSVSRSCSLSRKKHEDTDAPLPAGAPDGTAHGCGAEEPHREQAVPRGEGVEHAPVRLPPRNKTPRPRIRDHASAGNGFSRGAFLV